MRHERVIVVRDNNTKHQLTVGPWEIPVLEYLFGDVQRSGEFVDVPGREYPEPMAEMQRLNKAYGADVKTDEPHATAVYGVGRMGLKALTQAIEEAEEDEENAPKAPSATTGARRAGKLKTRPVVPAARRRHAQDPLLA